MKIRKSLKYIALPMAILMVFSSAAFAGPRFHHRYRGCGSDGWGIAAAGLIGGLLIGAIANSSRNSEPRQDPGEYRQDPGEYPQSAPTYYPPAYYPPTYTQPTPAQTGAKREVELAEKVPGGVIINGQFYAPAQQMPPTEQPYYYGNPSGYMQPSGPIKQDPGRTN